jgi:hypothetical protein
MIVLEIGVPGAREKLPLAPCEILMFPGEAKLESRDVLTPCKAVTTEPDALKALCSGSFTVTSVEGESSLPNRSVSFDAELLQYKRLKTVPGVVVITEGEPVYAFSSFARLHRRVKQK